MRGRERDRETKRKRKRNWPESSFPTNFHFMN